MFFKIERSIKKTERNKIKEIKTLKKLESYFDLIISLS